MKKKKNKYALPDYTLSTIQDEYMRNILISPEYSLSPDPSLNLDPEEIRFIAAYLQFNNIGVASELAGIDFDLGKKLFLTPEIQSEMNRIKQAMYARAFMSSTLDLDQIGGYLSSLITDKLPQCQQASTKEKLDAIKILLQIKEMKTKALIDGEIVSVKDSLDSEIRSLSINTIKQLLEASGDEVSEKELNKLSTHELLDIVNDSNKK